jgi:hypothetical protein
MTGVYSVPGDDPSLRIRVNYLSLLDDEGGELVRYCEYRNRFDFEDFLFDEKEHMPGFWYNVATAPDGRVFTAPRSDRYLINVYRPGGALERIVEREYPRWRRTGEEKQRFHRMVEEVFHDAPFPVRIGVEDFDPDILGLQRGLRFREDGNLWVLSSRGVREQPEGVLATWDVLSPDGEFLRQVALACPGDGRSDGVFFAGMDRVIVVNGYVDAVAAQYARGTRLSEGEGGEADDMQVVCYRVAGRDVTRGS